MFKTKLIAAAIALGVSGFANASITATDTGNAEFVFSAYDSAAGKGYTYDLSDLGWDDIFGDNVRTNSIIGSLNTTAAIGTTLVAKPANGILFDIALPSFSTFLEGANASNLKWNLVSAENAGIRRIIQTVSTDPSAPLTNAAVITSVANFNNYIGGVNGKGTNVGGQVLSDGYALTTSADGVSYAGGIGSNFGGPGYSSTGGVNDVLSLWVFGSTATTSNQNAGRVAQLLTADGQEVIARVYSGADGYHLQVALAPVPEPETYAMLLAGLGLLGFAARRKNV
ncbi:PEP-CTERM sorting domain-containing protein [Methyloversatilis universalis]|uniref:PEP-CTERM sorting domain-containing protein n=1 Tax=Methyloversatilis universalis TaxID=378211 RepID=UPI00036D0A32|nr:PEP-CTERM sorting domain-containing protein [Methyloversatilis universalis]